MVVPKENHILLRSLICRAIFIRKQRHIIEDCTHQNSNTLILTDNKIISENITIYAVQIVKYT